MLLGMALARLVTTQRECHHFYPLAQTNKNEHKHKTEMNTHHKTHRTPEAADLGEHLVQDAQELLAATAHVAEGKVMEARRRLAAAVEKSKEAWEALQEKAIAGAKATDHVIRENSYKALGTALGVGLIIGYFLRRRN
jgi:ElaB/YqjD/DUF883 family membrane-anchored ribosome-binding protein